MNAVTKTEPQEVVEKAKPSGLALLREPFLTNQISKLPKPTKRQTEEVRNDFSKGIRCPECGAWHHPKVVHLDYVGHAALTDRLLDCDPNWNWEPVATNEQGAPAFDSNGGMWIKLTVCGQTRLGYGDAEGKSGGNAIKEVIGDALRNAAMRFGAALDLWHKGDLHAIGDDANIPEPKPKFDAAAAGDRIAKKLTSAENLDDLRQRWTQEQDTIGEIRAVDADALARVVKAKDDRRAALEQVEAQLNSRPSDDLDGDQIPY